MIRSQVRAIGAGAYGVLRQLLKRRRQIRRLGCWNRLVNLVARSAEDQDSARKGKAVEHLVAATCILTSGLKLNVSTSLVDDEGVDLVFHRRGKSTTLAVQVKSRTMATKGISQRNRFYASVRAATFRPRADLYLLFVPVDAEEGTFPFVWLVPSKKFGRRPVNGRGRRVFSASMKDKSRDQWSKYRLDRADLANEILAALKKVGPR